MAAIQIAIHEAEAVEIKSIRLQFCDIYRDDRSNYRPISVLPFISRLFEKLIFNQFYEYLDANKSLYEHQSGFRLLHSVTTALMASTNDWYMNIDKGKYTGLIFIDLKKAFDTVDHEILLDKLKMYGVNGLENDWFTSYLDNRKQFCRINGSSSDVKGINCGVPQGSCLGPLLFLIYINDLPFSLQKSHVNMYVACVQTLATGEERKESSFFPLLPSNQSLRAGYMYADDTTISISSKSIGGLQNDLNLDLLKLQDWLHANKLSLNVLKTQSPIIGSGPNIGKIETQPDAQPSLSIGDQEIEMIANTKYLAVQVDSQLNWDKHVGTIKTNNACQKSLEHLGHFFIIRISNHSHQVQIPPRPRNNVDFEGYCPSIPAESGMVLSCRFFDHNTTLF